MVLDGVEDPQNLGASARSAEAAGAEVLVTRTHRAAPVTPAAVRASAGALVHLPHARVANIPRALDRLRDAGFTVVGLDGDAPTTIYGAEPPDGRVASCRERGERASRGSHASGATSSCRCRCADGSDRSTRPRRSPPCSTPSSSRRGQRWRQTAG